MKVAAIIKHPGRDWEGDVRVDIIDVPNAEFTMEEIKEQLQKEMLGPFEVLFLTTKINFDRKFILNTTNQG